MNLQETVEAFAVIGVELDQEERIDFLKYLEEKNGK